MKILVTGASGFLGSHVAEQLAAAGHSVRLLLRATSSRAWLTFGYEEALGDITDPAPLPAAVSGVDAVIHAAGLVMARSEAEFRLVNAGGTANLLAAAETHVPGLKRFVYVSSLAAHGPSPDGLPRPIHAPANPITAYGRSKLAAEDAVRASALADRAVIIRPPVLYGPRDPALLPFFRMAKLRVAPLLMGGRNRISVVYGPDAARAAVLAATAQAPISQSIPRGSGFQPDTAELVLPSPSGSGEGDEATAQATTSNASPALVLPSPGRGAGGEGTSTLLTYTLDDGTPHTWRDLLAAVEAALGRRALRLPCPRWTYEAAALASEAFALLARRPVPLTRDKVREMAQPHWVCDSAAIHRDLGWSPTVNIEEGARLTAAWYRAHRLL